MILKRNVTSLQYFKYLYNLMRLNKECYILSLVTNCFSSCTWRYMLCIRNEYMKNRCFVYVSSYLMIFRSLTFRTCISWFVHKWRKELKLLFYLKRFLCDAFFYKLYRYLSSLKRVGSKNFAPMFIIQWGFSAVLLTKLDQQWIILI